MSPAEELREAAMSMRRVAGRCDAGPWGTRNLGRHDRSAVVTRAAGAPILIGSFEGARGAANGVHAGKWHPGVALAVADWLDQEAGFYECYDPATQEFRAGGGRIGGELDPAVAVARAYLAPVLGEAQGDAG